MGTVLGIVKGVCTATGAVVLTITGASIIYGIVAKRELETNLKNEIKKWFRLLKAPYSAQVCCYLFQ